MTVAAKKPTETTSPVTTIRVVVADDHPVVRYGVKNMLMQEPGFEVVGEYLDDLNLDLDLDD